MAKKFRVILRDVLSISKSQELLRTEAENIPANSPRKNNLASEQQLLQDQLYKTMKKTMNLSKETFLVTSDMGQSLGQANAQMGASKTKLSERDSKGSLSNQSQAMTALNSSAKSIIQTINKMNEGGSASGYEEFLEQMKNNQKEIQQPKTKNKENISKADSLGFSPYEIIIIASIIEGEAIYDSERPTISAVYHNRLKRGMKLQADPTVQYIIKDGPRRLLNRDLRIKSPYNTYMYKGLPPGPINSPGAQSLHAALNPQTNDFLYFGVKVNDKEPIVRP